MCFRSVENGDDNGLVYPHIHKYITRGAIWYWDVSPSVGPSLQLKQKKSNSIVFSSE